MADVTVNVPLSEISARDRRIGELQNQLDAYKRTHWKVLPRGFIDDVEAIYDPAYRQANPNPQFTNFPTDPKAHRIRRRSEKWIWFFQHLANQPKIVDILRELNNDFRRSENISLRRALSASEEIRFTDFKRSACFSLAEVHEIGSFLVHGEAAVQLFMGDLNNLNIFGPQDLYLKPVLRALVPVVRGNVSVVGVNNP